MGLITSNVRSVTDGRRGLRRKLMYVIGMLGVCQFGGKKRWIQNLGKIASSWAGR